MEENRDQIRLEKIQNLAEKILDALDERINSSDSGELTPQAYRHLSGTLKDIKELFMLRSQADAREQALKLQHMERQLQEAAGQLTVEMVADVGAISM